VGDQELGLDHVQIARDVTDLEVERSVLLLERLQGRPRFAEVRVREGVEHDRVLLRVAQLVIRVAVPRHVRDQEARRVVHERIGLRDAEVREDLLELGAVVPRLDEGLFELGRMGRREGCRPARAEETGEENGASKDRGFHGA